MNESRHSGAPDWDPDVVERIATELKHEPGALLPILHRIQDELGWIPADSVPIIAKSLNLSRAEVHGVISFYHDFRHEPPARHLIKVCRAESCQAMGAIALAGHISRRLRTNFGKTSADGEFTLDAVYCFGNCACSPAIMIDGELIGRATPDSFDEAIERLKGGRRDEP
jgi:formate dehydrogenase subunit gamma